MTSSGVRNRSSSRRGRASGDAHSSPAERWVVSYADLVTLLFAFFVVMFAISQTDLKKFREIQRGLRQAISGQDLATAMSSPQTPASKPKADPFAASAPGAPLSGGVRGAQVAASAGSSAGSRASVLSELRSLLDEAALGEQSIQRSRSERADEVRWVVVDSYAPGSEKVPEDFWPLLRKVARVLARFPDLKLRWEGHVDAGEVQGAESLSWQLSADRALWLERFMQSQWERLDSVRAHSSEVAALGSSLPVTRETSRIARSQNRRVELVVVMPNHEAFRAKEP